MMTRKLAACPHPTRRTTSTAWRAALVLLASCLISLAPADASASGPWEKASTTNVVVNGGFESGTFAWIEESAGGYFIIDADPGSAHTGSYYAWLGGYEGGHDVLYQNVTIPADAGEATLRYWFNIATEETTQSAALDTLQVTIFDSSTGEVLMQVASYSNLSATQGWVQSPAFDLSGLRGRTVRLVFDGRTNDFNDTSFFLDDIELLATFADRFPVTVARSGTGTGSVSSSPAGIDCGSACSAEYVSGTFVTLTATPDLGSAFAGWSGDCTGTDWCTVFVDRARSVSASFLLATGPPRLVNIATRGMVRTGDDVMIAGFIIGGDKPKKVLVTARGPSLAVPPFNVPGTLADPFLQLFSGATQIDFNDDYGTRQNANQIPPSIRPANPKEAAILTTLAPGAYTAIVTGVGQTSGVAIVEVFEVDQPELPLTNIATRGRVETGDYVLIAGFIIHGDAPKTVVVTARGPSLAGPPHNVPGTLADPYLRLYSGQTVIHENDDWQGWPTSPMIPESQRPANDKDAAMMVTLAPGAYTAIVTGVNNAEGIAIIEVFAQ